MRTSLKWDKRKIFVNLPLKTTNNSIAPKATRMRSSHREFELLHMDPAREGVCAARSVHSEEEPERLTKRFWAQSIMQGAPETLNMMGGLTSVSIVWSKDRPAGWLDMDVSAITCREMSSPSGYNALCLQVKTGATHVRASLTRDGWSPV